MKKIVIIVTLLALQGCGGRLYTHNTGESVGLCLPIFGVSENATKERLVTGARESASGT
jgi:hypothetical protein